MRDIRNLVVPLSCALLIASGWGALRLGGFAYRDGYGQVAYTDSVAPSLHDTVSTGSDDNDVLSLSFFLFGPLLPVILCVPKRLVRIKISAFLIFWGLQVFSAAFEPVKASYVITVFAAGNWALGIWLGVLLLVPCLLLLQSSAIRGAWSRLSQTG